MKQLLTLLLLLATATLATAQTHTLRLANQQLPVLERSFYIEQVIDATITKGTVGEVQKGMTNKKVAAAFANPLEQELLEFIAAHHPQQEGQVPVILRVNKLWVSEHTTMSTETGSAELVVDFLYRQDDRHKKLHTATARTSQSGLDVTKKHEANIATVLHNCLKYFAAKDFDALLAQSEELADDAVDSPYNHTGIVSTFPIMQAAAPEEGIYMTLDEFRNNAPGITSGYEIKHRSGMETAMVGGGELMPVLKTEEGKTKSLKTAWGFTYRSGFYINYGGIFYPLVLNGEHFVFTGPPLNDGSTAIATGAMLGGLVGGAIASGVVAATAKPALYTLDLVTGSVHHNGKPVGANTADAKLIIYRKAKGENITPAQIKLNGEDFVLHQNDFIELDISTSDAGTSVAIAGYGKKPINFMPAPNKIYYIACSLPDNTDSENAKLTEVEKAQGEFDMKAITFAKKKANKQKK